MILPKEPVRYHVLNSQKFINTKFAIDYLVPPIRKELDDGLSLAIRRDLTRNFGKTRKASFDTIRELIDTLMGLQQSWHEVNLLGVLQPAISGVSYRMVVGETLYPNDDFMKSLKNFENILSIGSLLIGQFTPFFIATVIGYPASLLVFLYSRKALKYLVPEVQQEKVDPNFFL